MMLLPRMYILVLRSPSHLQCSPKSKLSTFLEYSYKLQTFGRKFGMFLVSLQTSIRLVSVGIWYRCDRCLCLTQWHTPCHGSPDENKPVSAPVMNGGAGFGVDRKHSSLRLHHCLHAHIALHRLACKRNSFSYVLSWPKNACTKRTPDMSVHSKQLCTRSNIPHKEM